MDWVRAQVSAEVDADLLGSIQPLTDRLATEPEDARCSESRADMFRKARL